MLCTDGVSWYQEENKEPRKFYPGDVVYIAPEVKHWHGASKDSWLSHIAIEIPNTKNEWWEPIFDEEYDKLESK